MTPEELWMLPHEFSGAVTPEDRICTCDHAYDYHVFRVGRLVCYDERGCKCRDFICVDHSVADINGDLPDCFRDEAAT